MRIGFDNERYLKEQSEEIRRRAFSNRLARQYCPNVVPVAALKRRET